MQRIYQGDTYEKIIVKDAESSDQFVCSAPKDMGLEVGYTYDINVNFNVGCRQIDDGNIFFQRAFVK